MNAIRQPLNGSNSMISGETSFRETAMAFYNNKECNSFSEFESDLSKIKMIQVQFVKHDDNEKTTNYRLLMNHFISFVNCFGVISEQLLKYKIPQKYHIKINCLFIFIGHKQFDGTVPIDENFFIELKKTI